jgi:hypothetical protein
MIPLLTPFSYLWKAIIDTFRGNKIASIAIIAVLVLGISQCNQCSNNRILKKKLAVAEHNLAAANDTIRLEKNKNGDIMTVKLAFLTDKLSNLEKLNEDLYNEVKNIKGKVSTIIKSDITVKEVDKPVPFIVEGKLADSTITTRFRFDSTYSPGNYRKLAGFTQYNLRNGQSNGSLTESEFGMRFTTGIRNLDKGKPEIFLQSNYPGFTVTSLDGAVLDPNLLKGKGRPLITPGITVGWTPVTYSWKTKKAVVDLQQVGITAGVSINILKLLNPNK